MLYKIAHILRDKLPWIWDVIGIINSFLFGLRYDGKMGQVQKILTHFTKTTEEDGNALFYKIIFTKNLYLIEKRITILFCFLSKMSKNLLNLPHFTIIP